METIELQQTLPEVFAGRDRVISDVWHREIAFQKGKIYLLEAASGTGALFLLTDRISTIYLFHNGCIYGKLR